MMHVRENYAKLHIFLPITQDLQTVCKEMYLFFEFINSIPSLSIYQFTLV